VPGQRTAIGASQLCDREVRDHETRLRNAVDELDEFLTAIALALCQLDKFPRPRDQQTFRRCVTRHRDTPSAAKLQESFIPQGTQCPEDRVRVDFKHGGQVPRRRKSFPSSYLLFRDGPSEVSCHLFVERGGVIEIDTDIEHGDSYNITMPQAEQMTQTELRRVSSSPIPEAQVPTESLRVRAGRGRWCGLC
jgi:hypothetical protein